jgi:zinc protease
VADGRKESTIMQHSQTKLPNNLETLFIDSPGSNAASVQIWFRAGSALENQENQGIAHFLEHMFFKGTEKRPGSALTHQVESFGGEMNAFTSFDYTCYYINSPNNHLPTVVEILMDMISNPVFKNEDIVPERGVVFEEYRRSQDNPGQFGFQRLQENCFQDGYKHPILGAEKTIKNFSQDQLKNFRKNFYNLSNSLFVVAGDLKEKEKIVSIIEKYKVPEGPKSDFPKFSLKDQDTFEVHQQDVKMSRLTLAISTPLLTDPKSPAEDLVLNCLGHGETSRLYRKLVAESSMANSVSASTMFMNKGGVHFINLTFPHKNLPKIIKSITSLWGDAIKDGFTKEEIGKIKNQYVASKIYEKETLESYAFSLGSGFAQTGNIFGHEEFLEKLKKTTLHQVNQSLLEISGRSIHIGLQIPKENSIEDATDQIKKFQKSLKSLDKKSKPKSKTKTMKSDFDPQVQIVKLKEGINLLYRKNETSPTFVFHGYIKGGLTDENPQSNGSYNLISALLTKGFKDISEKEIKHVIENNSANLNGFSGKNAYGLTLHGISENLPTLFPFFTGCFLKSKMAPKDFIHEREMVFRSLDNQDKNPLQQCFKKIDNLMFFQHPYSMNILGSKESLKKLNSKKLLGIHKSNLKKKEILFSYCGNQELEEIIELLTDPLKLLPARKVKAPLAKKINPITNQKEFITFDREQTQIFIGFPSGKMGDKENLYLKMLTTHFSGQSSELFVEVRDKKGLAYSAQPIHMQGLEGGYWGIYMASGHDKVKEAVKTIHEILDRVSQKGLKKEEFERIKSMIEGQDLINIQTNEDYANIYSIPLLQGLGVDYFYKNNEKIKHLQYDDFQNQIQKILSRKRNIVVVGREN